jgi:mRNA interferase MazF
MGPSRGEVWLVDLGYIGKVRPGLVLSIEPLDTDRALVTLVPHTTSPRGTRFEVDLKPRFLKSGAFDAQNPITAPRAKLLKKLGILTADEMT